MTMLLRQISHNYREGGARQVIRKVAFRVQAFVASKAVWTVYEITPVPYCGKATAHTFSFEELIRLRYFKAVSFPEAIRSRFEIAECYGFVVDDCLASVAWLQPHSLDLDGSTSLPAEYAIYDCWTDPRFRGRGFYPELLRILLGISHARGVSSVKIAVDPGNLPSIKGVERAGFQKKLLVVKTVRWGRTALSHLPSDSTHANPA